MNPHALLAVAVRLILRELADGSNKLPLGIEALLLFQKLSVGFYQRVPFFLKCVTGN
jgi:hypothetical protein